MWDLNTIVALNEQAVADAKTAEIAKQQPFTVHYDESDGSFHRISTDGLRHDVWHEKGWLTL